MTAFLRTLEEWTTHQDYFWFLAVLAWGGFIAAEWRRKDIAGDPPMAGWRLGLALGCIASAVIEMVLLAQDLLVPYTKLDFAMGAAQAATAAVIEMVLLAQDLLVPYTKLDFAMGAAQAATAAALAWGAMQGKRHAAFWRGTSVVVALAAAILRLWWPVEAGAALCFLQALAVLGLLRQQVRSFSAAVGLLLVLAPIVATHGPWAYAINQGRRVTDWSHFSIPAAVMLLAPGVVLVVAAWRRRLEQVMPYGSGPAAMLRRDLRRAVYLLAAWLCGGVLLAVLYGREARQAYEQGLVSRAEMALMAIGPRALSEALEPQLKIEKIDRRTLSTGEPVDVATVPVTLQPSYLALRERMAAVKQRNPDLRGLYVATWREGRLLLLTADVRRRVSANHVANRQITSEDLLRIAERKTYTEGPFVTIHSTPFSVQVPILHDRTEGFLGWLVAEVDATRWAVTFTRARLQTMGLVGVGVGLWALAIAYRLRRESRDAAEHKATEAAAADRTKSAFLAKVSHELRTPIQSVLGYGELLSGAPLGDTQRAWLSALRTHGDIMLRLVNDLIDLGGLQSGAFRLEPSGVELREAVDDCASALRPAAAAKGLRFDIEVTPDVPAWVQVDGVRLRQILLNLLNNAVKFTVSGGVALTVRRRGGEIEFTVADTGPGIPEAQRSRLFQPFARLDPAAGGGSGLGLALVQGLCGAMGGSVQLVESPAGATGAVFVVRLPLAVSATPTGVSPTVEMPPLRDAGFAGLRVLVAEDNTLVRALLMAFLTENGAEVTTAVDGPTALALAREREPDVLLLDIGLPGMDGIAVARELRREGPRALRIVGLSAHASAQDEAHARAAGMDLFLAKPVRLAALAEALVPKPVVAAQAKVAARIGDDRLRTQLLGHFAEETPRVLSEMRAAIAAADWERLRSRAHYLKNSADVLGETALQEACQHIVVARDLRDAALARPLLAAVEAAIPVQLFLSAHTAPTDQN